MRSIRTADLGLSGSGGAQTDSDTVSISVLPIYDSNDFLKVQAFLDQPSAVAGKTNGQMINSAYDSNTPTTWRGGLGLQQGPIEWCPSELLVNGTTNHWQVRWI